MPKLSYLKAMNRALADSLDEDPAVFLLGEDIRAAASNLTAGLLTRFGPERVLDTPLSEQAFTNFATGAALAGLRPVIEFQIPSLLFLVFEQIANQAHKFSLMTGGQCKVPVTYVVTGSGSRTGWAGQHSDHPYTLLAHVGVKTVVPSTPADAYGLMLSAIRDDDPVVFFAPSGALGVREDLDFAALAPVPLGTGRLARVGSDVTIVALGHLVYEALVVADELAGQGISVEVLDPRTVYPLDTDGLLASVVKTGRLVVFDDSNRTSGFAAEVLAVAAERCTLDAPPRRVTRPNGAVLPFALALDRAVQPDRDQLVAAIHAVLENS
ncbi:transketolase C-terminal domain-containing protein [Kribbella sp. NPDC026611]|uniref:alpha-ketoacid dehydrogenase subunit beta n=1 Tax=Kribbella sp. NPDC026611 TaxID=3154911 RepID=UPI0033EDD2AA